MRQPAKRSGSRRVADATAGFTLLEVMVAFAIAAPAVVLLARACLAALTATAVSVRYNEAVSRANSLLCDVADDDLAAGDWRGSGNGFAWRRRVVAVDTLPPLRPIRVTGPYTGGTTLYAISVAVSWGASDSARQVLLETTRLGPATGRTP